MAAPQLRLLFAAGLRGLIRPDYPNGRQSRIREDMICRAIDQEQHGQSMVASAQARLGLLTSLAMQGADGMEVYNHAIRLMAIGYDLQQLHPVSKIQKSIDAPQDISAYERMAEMLKALNSSDIKARLPVD